MNYEERVGNLVDQLSSISVEKLTDWERSFVNSMMAVWPKYRSLTPKQEHHVRRIVRTHIDPPPNPGNLLPVFTLFDYAGTHLKYPKLDFDLGDTVGIVRFKRVGSRGKRPGSINVTDDGHYPHNVWYGCINTDGTYHCNMPSKEIATLLAALAADPTGALAEYGKKSGACCMCRLPITTETSMAMGYGPVCAKNWGLPYG